MQKSVVYVISLEYAPGVVVKICLFRRSELSFTLFLILHLCIDVVIMT